MAKYGVSIMQWPLKPCAPVYDWDGDLFCKTHSHGPYYNVRYGYNLIGHKLPPKGTLCTKAAEITQIAKAVIQEIEERDRAARKFWASGDENGKCF